jgi:putative spermidine/putrescine transport system permease protein
MAGTPTRSSRATIGSRRRGGATRMLLLCFSYLAVLFLISPIVVVILTAFTATNFVVFPPEGFSTKWYVAAIQNRDLSSGLKASLLLAVVSGMVATVLGAAAALGLAMGRFPGRDALATLFLSPLMLPAVVLGIALLHFMAQLGLLGGFPGVLLGHLLIVAPYAVRLVGTSLGGFDWDIYRAARILGANPWRALFRVVVPAIYPGLVAAFAFAFIMSFDEVTVSLFLTGPEFNTLPVVIFRWIEYSYEPIVAAASAITVGIACCAMFVIFGVFGVERVFGVDDRR